MKFKEIINFKKELYFDGAVQIDWFYNKDKASLVSKNFVFHGDQYYGVEDSEYNKNRIDTISLTLELAKKLNDDSLQPLSLAIADYGTGKSHLAITVAELFSGPNYMPETYNSIIKNIEIIDSVKANEIKTLTNKRNFIIVLNGMKDFNLHYELLKATKKSLELYGYDTNKLIKLNRALETADSFFSRNSNKFIDEFENVAKKHNWEEKGLNLIEKIKSSLMIDDETFDIVNEVYKDINGQEIRWDEDLSAHSILEMLINEYCGLNGDFDHIIILFDEFGRYLEYASNVNSIKSGDSALQQIFEITQNYEGILQVINFIQSDIKTYLQRIDQTKNISRYIGRYDASDKYYISSNLETVIANLIQRVDKIEFDEYIKQWQTLNENNWQFIFNKLNLWNQTKGIWKNYKLFRKTIVEGIYPLHPYSTYILTQLSDYLQNRSSLTLISSYIENLSDQEMDKNNPILIMPEKIMNGDLYYEMLSSEQEGKQLSQQCIRFDNILRKFGDKLSEKSMKVLRSNLVIRLLRFRTSSYEDCIIALSICSGLTIDGVKEELKWLETEYNILGFDNHANCFDFMEESNGAINFKNLKKKLISNYVLDIDYIKSLKIRQIADAIDPINTNYGTRHKINTLEWLFKQEIYPIEYLNNQIIEQYVNDWKESSSVITPKGRIVWLYCNKNSNNASVENAIKLASTIKKMPILFFLLNDDDNKLYNLLIEYKILDELDDTSRKKYERYYIDDFQQVQTSLNNLFSELKKKRLIICDNKINIINERLPIYLSNCFETIYPNSISFEFDGLITKNNTLSPKGSITYCSIIKMLLSNQVNYDAIHNFPMETRNRIETLFLNSSISSWQCLNNKYQLTPPQNKFVKEIYTQIYEKIINIKKYSCLDIFSIYTKPPYGIADEILILLLAIIIANNSYCLRLECNNEILNVNSWKSLIVINDKQVKINDIKKTTILYVDTNAVITKYKVLFKQIENNSSIYEVNKFNKNLENYLKSDELPKELETEYKLAYSKLNTGIETKEKWNMAMSSIENEFYLAKEKDNFYNAVNALNKVYELKPNQIFNNEYIFDEDSKNELISIKDEIKEYIGTNIDKYVNSLTCRTVEGINTFKNHNSKIEKMLTDVGLSSFATKIKSRKEKILNNIENIKSAQNLRTDLAKYFSDTKNAENTTYTNIAALKSKGNELKDRIDKYSDILGNDYDLYNSKLQNEIKVLTSYVNDINNEISQIWDMLFDCSAYEDIIKILNSIDIVVKKGLKKEDNDQLIEIKNNLEELLNDLKTYINITDDREEAHKVANSLLAKYRDSDFDFDVIEIINTIINNKKCKFDEKENVWMKKYSNIDGLSRNQLLNWFDETQDCPKYLEKKNYDKIEALRIRVSDILSKGKIDDVIFYFYKLTTEEKRKCIDEINKIMKSNTR